MNHAIFDGSLTRTMCKMSTLSEDSRHYHKRLMNNLLQFRIQARFLGILYVQVKCNQTSRAVQLLGVKCKSWMHKTHQHKGRMKGVIYWLVLLIKLVTRSRIVMLTGAPIGCARLNPCNCEVWLILDFTRQGGNTTPFVSKYSMKCEIMTRICEIGLFRAHKT